MAVDLAEQRERAATRPTSDRRALGEPGRSAPPVATAGADLVRQGFARVPREALGPADFVSHAAAMLEAATADLPPDPYCAERFRFRRYARLFMLPWTGLLLTAPPRIDESGEALQMYQHPATLNVDEAGVGRWFPALDAETLAADWLDRIIRFDFDQTAFTEEERASPIQVGVHLVDHRPRVGQPAAASPNCVHRDGEHYTCAHLIHRSGVTGGENHITDPEWAGRAISDVPAGAIRAGFTLERPLDGYIVRDDRVAHHVDAVELAPNADAGRRTMLLIDFTPMRPHMLMDAAVC